MWISPSTTILLNRFAQDLAVFFIAGAAGMLLLFVFILILAFGDRRTITGDDE